MGTDRSICHGFVGIVSRGSWFVSPMTISIGNDLKAWTRLSQGKSYRQVEQPVGELYRRLNFSISPS